jgi:hypothetical protein
MTELVRILERFTKRGEYSLKVIAIHGWRQALTDAELKATIARMYHGHSEPDCKARNNVAGRRFFWDCRSSVNGGRSAPCCWRETCFTPHGYHFRKGFHPANRMLVC